MHTLMLAGGTAKGSTRSRAAASAPPRILFGKRCLDIALVVLLLPFLAVATLLVSVVMKLTSPGPIFFLQERIGFHGRRFMIYKFRTMHAGADSAVHRAHCERLIAEGRPMTKIDSRGDSRMIPGGRWIRASGLDELPQIINVILGHMSLVGPRPCLPFEYDKYQPWQRERLDAVPGLSGLWQVSGKNQTTFEEMIRLDIKYVHQQSWQLDAKIIVLTPLVLFRQVGQLLPAPSRSQAV